MDLQGAPGKGLENDSRERGGFFRGLPVPFGKEVSNGDAFTISMCGVEIRLASCRQPVIKDETIILGRYAEEWNSQIVNH